MIDNNTYNPFAASAFYKFSRPPAEEKLRKKEGEKEWLKKLENFKKLTAAIEIIHNFKTQDFNETDLHRIHIGDLLNFNYKRIEFARYCDAKVHRIPRRVLLTGLTQQWRRRPKRKE